MWLLLKMTWKLQLVQNVTACLLAVAGRNSHITSIVQVVHWLPIPFCAQCKVLVFYM